MLRAEHLRAWGLVRRPAGRVARRPAPARPQSSPPVTLTRRHGHGVDMDSPWPASGLGSAA